MDYSKGIEDNFTLFSSLIFPFAFLAIFRYSLFISASFGFNGYWLNQFNRVAGLLQLFGGYARYIL